MGTKRTRKFRHRRPVDVPDDIRRFLETGDERLLRNPWVVFDAPPGSSVLPSARECWDLVREDVLAKWARERPGELPWAAREYDGAGSDRSMGSRR